VDDSDINLDVAKRILELQGARVWLAGNGEEAVHRLRDEPNGFDLVLMDVQMPVLDGHAATRRIRAELGLAHLPIIALTAGALSSDRGKALAAGMNDFIIKPFDPHKLVQSVLQHAVGAHPAAGVRLAQAPAAAPGSALPWPDIDGIDTTAARGRFGDDVGLFLSLLGRLLTEFTDTAILKFGESPTDCAFAGRIHKLKGSAGTLGALAIHRLAGLIEEACTVGNGPEIQRLTAQLAIRMRRLHDAAPTSAATAAGDPVSDPAATERALESGDLANLARMLRLQTQSSIDLFHALAPQLRLKLEASPYASLQEQIDTLQFAAAADALEAWQGA
jgi:CheY-like chemotaxis protein/HPt (histidine-containing phosphotransfer) domain-containing protein